MDAEFAEVRARSIFGDASWTGWIDFFVTRHKTPKNAAFDAGNGFVRDAVGVRDSTNRRRNAAELRRVTAAVLAEQQV